VDFTLEKSAISGVVKKKFVDFTSSHWEFQYVNQKWHIVFRIANKDDAIVYIELPKLVD